MRDGDVDAVAAIEAQAYDFPWSRRTVAECLQAGHECWLALVGERPTAGAGGDARAVQPPFAGSQRLAGYGILSTVVDEAQLLNVCIEATMRGRGHGRALTRHMVDRAVVRGAKVVFLEVRLSNRIAMTLYDTIGFREIGRRRNYYRAPNGREDAMVMALTLG